jgi:hypothetical protein
LTVFACGQAHTLGQRHVDLGRIARRVIQMIDGYLALQKAESRRAVGRSIVRSRIERPRRTKKQEDSKSSTQILTPPTWRRERAHKASA